MAEYGGWVTLGDSSPKPPEQKWQLAETNSSQPSLNCYKFFCPVVGSRRDG